MGLLCAHLMATPCAAIADGGHAVGCQCPLAVPRDFVTRGDAGHRCHALTEIGAPLNGMRKRSLGLLVK